MFGRRSKGPALAPSDQELAVDSDLEIDVSEVEEAVDNFLANQSEQCRQGLRKALEKLDTETEESDAYASRMAWPSMIGAPSPEVIGETGPYPWLKISQPPNSPDKSRSSRLPNKLFYVPPPRRLPRSRWPGWG
jgi:hypothetical protein